MGNVPGSTNRRRSEDNPLAEAASSPAQTVPGSPLLYGTHTAMEPPPRPEEIPEAAGFSPQPKLVPVMIVWNHRGNDVAVEGSFDNWTTRHKLQRTGNTFTVVKLLPPGVYQYKFIVDREWKYDPNQPAMHDDAGNVNNVIEVREFVPENLGGLDGFDPPPSPRESYICDELNEVDLSREPPAAPSHLQYTLLNVSCNEEASQVLPRPWHVTLNHVYIQRNSPVSSPSDSWATDLAQNVQAMVLGTTQRYQSKYVTTIMYKPRPRLNRQSSLQN